MANRKMTTCKHCGAQIAAGARVCPQCGGKNKKPIYKRPWFIILIVILLLALLSSGNGNSSQKDSSLKVGEVEANTSTLSSNDNSDTVDHDTASTDSFDQTTNSEVTQSDTSGSVQSTSEPAKTAYYVGDILVDGGMKIVYAASGTYNEDNSFMQPKDGMKYIYLKFAFINESNSDKSISFYSFDAYADGYACEMYYGGSDDLSASLSSGRQTLGYIYFEVPEDAQDIEIEYEPNMFTDRKIYFVYEGDVDSGFELEPITTRAENAYSVGDIVETKNIRITYLSCTEYQSDNMFVQSKDGYRYYSVELEFENIGSSDQSVSSFSFDCYADGVDCSQTFIRDDNLSATLSAGRKTKGTVTFEVPDKAEVVEVEYNDNIWTSNRIVFTVR